MTKTCSPKMVVLPKAGHGVSALSMGEKTAKVRGNTGQARVASSSRNGPGCQSLLETQRLSSLQTTDFKCKGLIFNMKATTLSLFQFKKAHGPSRVAQQSLQWGLV